LGAQKKSIRGAISKDIDNPFEIPIEQQKSCSQIQGFGLIPLQKKKIAPFLKKISCRLKKTPKKIILFLLEKARFFFYKYFDVQ